MSREQLVVQVVPYYPPHLGGMENAARGIAEALSERGEVEVLTTDCGARSAPRREGSGSLRVRRVRAVELAHTPVAPGLLWRLLRLPKSAIVHLHIAQALVPEMVWLASVLRRRPFIAHFHLDVDPSGRLGGLFLAYKRWILGPTLRAASRVIALSPEQAEFMVERYGVSRSRLVVVPNGVGSEFLVPYGDRRLPDGPLRLLYVGRLSAQKNLPRLLHAIADMSHAAELVIVGDGAERSRVERLVEQLGLGNVRLIGARRGPELIEWYRWADVFVLASDKEGMPLVLLEAMAAGLPIVSTDVPGSRELVGDAGLLTGCDPAALAAGLDTLAADAQLRARLADASRRRGRAKTWTGLVGEVEAVYEAAT